MFVVPEDTVRRLPASEGQVVGDFGCGTGAWALSLSKLVGDAGHVYAFEVQQNLLETLEKDAREKGITNIETVWADLDEEEGSRLDRDSVDGVLIANALFQFENKEAVIKEAYRVLRPGGWCAVIDWSESFGGLGPTTADVVSKDVARALCVNQSFVFNGEIETGEHHYGLIFKK
ncbi:MAG: class I SAM-dependent methyltransferase [bacterium]|nr:class I SAM-dependent methyltransferase [bacterium]